MTIILTIVMMMMIEIPKKLGPSDVIRSVDHLSENPRKSNCGEEREAGSPTCNCAEMMMVMTMMVMMVVILKIMKTQSPEIKEDIVNAWYVKWHSGG